GPARERGQLGPLGKAPGSPSGGGLLHAGIEALAAPPEEFAVAGAGPGAAREVEVAALRAVPRPHVGLPVRHDLLARREDPADAGLAQVVQGAPDEFTDDVGLPRARGPVLEGREGEGLGGDDDPAREPGVVG